MTTSVTTRTPGMLNPTRQQLDELDALLKRMLELPVNKADDAEAEDDDEAPEPSFSPLPRTWEREIAGEAASPPPPLLSPEVGEKTETTKPVAPLVSYMVVETASPRPLPAASGFETRPSALMPRLVPVTPRPESTAEDEPASSPPQQTPAKIASEEAEVWVPLRSTWKPSAQTWQPLAENWHQTHGTTPLSASMPAPTPSLRLELTPPAERMHPSASEGRGEASGEPTSARGEIAVSSDPAPSAPAPAAEPRLRLTAEDAPGSVSAPLLPLLWFNQGFDACLAPLGAPGRWLGSSGGRQLLGIVGLVSLAAAAAVVASAGMGWTW